MDEELKTKIENFAEIARRYCVWAENPAVDNAVDNSAEMQTAQRILAELFLNIIGLPDNVFEDEDVKLEDVSTEQWKVVRDRFSNLPVDRYWTIFDPSKTEDKEAVWAEISDDLADIYRDLKYGLTLFDAGHISEAVWEWRFHFNVHWGRHLLNAQKVIYSWIYREI